MVSFRSDVVTFRSDVVFFLSDSVIFKSDVVPLKSDLSQICGYPQELFFLKNTFFFAFHSIWPTPLSFSYLETRMQSNFDDFRSIILILKLTTSRLKPVISLLKLTRPNPSILIITCHSGRSTECLEPWIEMQKVSFKKKKWIWSFKRKPLPSLLFV